MNNAAHEYVKSPPFNNQFAAVTGIDDQKLIVIQRGYIKKNENMGEFYEKSAS